MDSCLPAAHQWNEKVVVQQHEHFEFILALRCYNHDKVLCNVGLALIVFNGMAVYTDSQIRYN